MARVWLLLIKDFAGLRSAILKIRLQRSMDPIATAVFLLVMLAPFPHRAASENLFVGLLTCAWADVASANQSSAFPVSQ